MRITKVAGQRPVGCVSALYVQTDGAYYGIEGVDPWDEQRDARQYAGPWPVVAHPPCQLWGAMAAVNYARWGGEHNRPGNDGGCFAAALAAVNRWGGVLEHPAKTRAWAAYGLEKPAGVGWQRSGNGWVCEVWQSAYGHRANKATWLYYKGQPRQAARARNEVQDRGERASRIRGGLDDVRRVEGVHPASVHGMDRARVSESERYG